MPNFRKLNESEYLPRGYGKIDLLATWRDQLQNVSVVHMVVNPDQETSYHYHPHEEVFIALKGQAIAYVGDKIYDLAPMDTLACLANEPHKIRNINNDQVFECIIVVSPHRDPKRVSYIKE